MQRKLVTLVNCQLMEVEGRARAGRAARSLGERSVTELILQHQNPQQLSANLWAAVRARGCQFLGPAMQEEVLKLVLLALEDGSALSRKVLVMFVVQRLEAHFPQASKTSIGHVVQLLYRASCFKVTKRDGDSSLMQLKEEFRTYETLRREHDTQIVQIATEAGLRIAPDQWSSLLYGDAAHKSHMQSIIDKLQTPQSFGQSVQELVIALQRTGDPGKLTSLRPELDILTNIDPSPEAELQPDWKMVMDGLQSAKAVITGLVNFVTLSGYNQRRMGGGDGGYSNHVTRYKTSLCKDLSRHGSCPRGNNCTFAHSQQELDMHRRGLKKPGLGSTAGRMRHESSQSLPQHQTPSPDPSVHHLSPKPDQEVEERKVKPAVPVVQPQAIPQAAAGGAAVPVLAGAAAPLPVAQVAPIPRVIPREIPVETFQVTPLVDQNGVPMIDAATGQQLVAAPMVAAQTQLFQPVQIAGADGNMYAVQPAAQPIQMATLQVAPAAMMVAPPNPAAPQQLVVQQQVQLPPPHPPPAAAAPQATPAQQRDMKHELSPEIASKSLSALKDRKDEILNELGDIVGESNAYIISDIAKQQADVEVARFTLDAAESSSRRNSLNQQQQVQFPRQGNQQIPQQSHHRQTPTRSYQRYPQQQQQLQQQPPQRFTKQPKQQQENAASFSIWTSRPLITMNSLHENKQFTEDEIEALPDGICVSKFGPISRKNLVQKPGVEPRAVTANIGLATRPTISVRQPLASASPLPDGLLIMQDQQSVLNYDPGTDSHYLDHDQKISSMKQL